MRQSIHNYFMGVKKRMSTLLWLFISLLAILTLNNLIVQDLLSNNTTYLSPKNIPLLWNTLWMATLLYFIPILISHPIVRKVIVIVELTLLSAMQIMDIYLVSSYLMPYCDTIATPIFATNASEAQGFFKSLKLDIPFMLIECGKLLLAIFLPLGMYCLINYMKSTEKLSSRIKTGIKRYSSLVLTLSILIGTHVLGIRYIHKTRTDVKEGIVQYNAHAPLARLVLSNRVLLREAKRCNLSYTPCQAHPQMVTTDTIPAYHEIILIVAEDIYPHLMHCYNPNINDNTPTIDSLIQTGHLIKLDSIYSASENEALAIAWTLSLCPKDSPDSWDTYPSIYSVFRAAGYGTYWLDNTPRIAHGLDVYPQFAADCDTSYFTNLRVDEQNWTDSIPYDGAILNQLKTVSTDNCLTTIHLMGGRSNVWWRIPTEFQQFNRRSAAIDIPLSGDALDNLAQYYNVIYYQDYLLGKIINHYQERPALIIYCSPRGAYGDWHPYSGDAIAPETKGQVPMLVYLTPAMQGLLPTLPDQLQQLNGGRHNLSDFPQFLKTICGIVGP